MSTILISLGKYGDVIQILPALYHRFKETGEKQNLMVAKDYAPLLTGCSHIEPFIFNGHFQDLKEAIKIAKKNFDEVIVLSTFGKDYPVQKRCPSFQLDQWLRAGLMDKFGELPLRFDKRNKYREGKLLKTIPKDKPFILLADHSESSPFEHKDELALSLKSNFPEHNVVRLSEVKAEFLYDLIGLYDKAAALVTIDTAHLHLSAASKVPTFALATDQPDKWRGSFWQPRFALYCRYGEWSDRKGDLLTSLKKTLNGETKEEIVNPKRIAAKEWIKCDMVPPLAYQAKVEPILFTRQYNGYNPSIIEFEGRKLVIFRWHQERGFKTILHMGYMGGEKTKPVLMPSAYDGMSHEDARLFTFNKKLYASFTISKIPQNPPTCVVAYGELEEADDHWIIRKYFQPRHGRNDFGGMEKNWLFHEWEGKLFCFYDGNTVLELDGEKVVNTHHNPPIGQLRGGAIVPHGGNLLRFYHYRLDKSKHLPRYFVGTALLESKPPFKVIKVSQEPLLIGSEWEVGMCYHWKSNVIFPSGVIKDGSDFLLSCGCNDFSSTLVKIPASDLNL